MIKLAFDFYTHGIYINEMCTVLQLSIYSGHCSVVQHLRFIYKSKFEKKYYLDLV